MTKRRLEGAIDDASEEVLGDLDPDDRLQLFIEAAAARNEDWLERLRETAPVHTYRATDLAYVDRGRTAIRFLNQAMYDLHTTVLHHELLDLRQRIRVALDLTRDEEPSEEVLERAGARADEIKDLFMELYTCYHAYRQFATDVLGVDFETWAALHPTGPAVLDAVEDVLNDELRYELAEELLNADLATQVHETDADTADEYEWITLDELADQRFQGYVELWDQALAEMP